MSGSSDSDEYYDAEDITANKLTSEHNLFRKAKPASLTPSKSESDFQTTLKQDERKSDVTVPAKVPNSLSLQTGLETTGIEKIKRHKLKEVRKRMQTEDEETFNTVGTSPTSSQTSSFDGVFPAPDTRSIQSHPFRIIEHDALSLHSLTSLGRIGRILSSSSQDPPTSVQGSQKETGPEQLGGSTNTLKCPSEPGDEEKSEGVFKVPAPVRSEERRQLQEPDVIASTKPSNQQPPNNVTNTEPAPVAPPRRRKKNKPAQPPSSLAIQKKDENPSQLMKSMSVEDPTYKRATLPSPASTIESITREFEHSLDMRGATKGECHVKTQESSRAKCSRSVSRNSSTYPLGGGAPTRPSRERRRSAGDEQSLLPNQLNMFVRTRTESGKPLSDLEILEQVTVLNLDTGERVPLSIAEDKLPQCINPLSLHIMRLTSEYVSNTSLEKQKESDEESVDSKVSRREDEDEGKGGVRRRTAQIKKFLGTTVKKTMIRAKTIGRHNRDDTIDLEAEQTTNAASTATPSTNTTSGEQYIKLKASNSHKGPYEFDCVLHVQDMSGEHTGPVWCMKFSSCGRLLATAGQDRVLRIWVVRNAYPYFQDMRTKYNAEKVSPTPSQESIVSVVSAEDTHSHNMDELSEKAPFMPKPFCTYTGHASDLLDVAWSKNYFILSSSMDKTVRLWHISRRECLCCFQHIDFVTAIVFHPRDDRYFLSGSLDGKLRLWNIPDKKVAVWNEIDGPAKLITAANFCQNGKFAVVGSYDGRCIFYTTDQLKYYTQIHVRSTRGKNSTGRKISGIEPMPGEDKILVTSNDSRIRLYDLRDLNLSCKYKGYANFSSQIKASFSHDGKFIVSGSENQCIYIWKSNHDYSKFSSVRRDRNDYWEGIKVHNAVVTCAVFSPNPDIIMRQIEELEGNVPGVANPSGYVLVSADFNGCIKVFINKTKPKHSSLPASAMA